MVDITPFKNGSYLRNCYFQRRADAEADKLLETARLERERGERFGPRPVRYGGYVIHAVGNQIWFTPAWNSEKQSDTVN